MIYIASDHRGYKLKTKLIKFFEKNNYQYTDLGTDSEERTDYTIYCKKVVDAIKKDKDAKGILICGTGLGMSIYANRFKGIRATLCKNTTIAKRAREHNDANILVLSGEFTSCFTAKRIFKVFNTTQCLGERYTLRNQILDK